MLEQNREVKSQKVKVDNIFQNIHERSYRRKEYKTLNNIFKYNLFFMMIEMSKNHIISKDQNGRSSICC